MNESYDEFEITNDPNNFCISGEVISGEVNIYTYVHACRTLGKHYKGTCTLR